MSSINMAKTLSLIAVTMVSAFYFTATKMYHRKRQRAKNEYEEGSIVQIQLHNGDTVYWNPS